MSKSTDWKKATEIMNRYKIKEDSDFFKEMAVLYRPKKAGKNDRPEPIIDEDGKIYYYCRFTGRYWLSDDMIYQNDKAREEKKDKGYSKVGISIWNKGQKYLKDLKNETMEIIMSDDDPTDETRERMKELKNLIGKFDGNDYHELEQFLTDEQKNDIEDYSIGKS